MFYEVNKQLTLNFRSKRDVTSKNRLMQVGEILVDNHDGEDFDLNFHVNLNLSKLFNQGETSLGHGFDDYLDNFDKNFNFDDQNLVEEGR